MHPATAQLVALLLQQGERANQMMEALVRENRELRCVFATHTPVAIMTDRVPYRVVLVAELRDVKAQLAAVREPLGLHAMEKEEEEEEPQMQFDDTALDPSFYNLQNPHLSDPFSGEGNAMDMSGMMFDWVKLGSGFRIICTQLTISRVALERRWNRQVSKQIFSSHILDNNKTPLMSNSLEP